MCECPFPSTLGSRECVASFPEDELPWASFFPILTAARQVNILVIKAIVILGVTRAFRNVFLGAKNLNCFSSSDGFDV